MPLKTSHGRQKYTKTKDTRRRYYKTDNKVINKENSLQSTCPIIHNERLRQASKVSVDRSNLDCYKNVIFQRDNSI